MLGVAVDDVVHSSEQVDKPCGKARLHQTTIDIRPIDAWECCLEVEKCQNWFLVVQAPTTNRMSKGIEIDDVLCQLPAWDETPLVRVNVPLQPPREDVGRAATDNLVESALETKGSELRRARTTE